MACGERLAASGLIAVVAVAWSAVAFGGVYAWAQPGIGVLGIAAWVLAPPAPRWALFDRGLLGLLALAVAHAVVRPSDAATLTVFWWAGAGGVFVSLRAAGTRALPGVAVVVGVVLTLVWIAPRTDDQLYGVWHAFERDDAAGQPFISRTDLAVWCVLALGLVVGAARVRRPWLWLLLGCGLVLTIRATGSRAPYAVAGVVLLVTAGDVLDRVHRIVLGAGTAVAVLWAHLGRLALGAGIGPDVRLEAWTMARYQIHTAPWLGAGLGTAPLLGRLEVPDPSPPPLQLPPITALVAQAHAVPLQAGVEAGIVLTAAIAIIVAWGACYVRTLPRTPWRTCAVAGLVGAALCGFTDTSLWRPGCAVLAAAVAGIAASEGE